MNPRREFLIAAGLGLLGTRRSIRAQPGAAIRRVGILHPASEADGAAMRTPFKEGMHALGWFEGKNVEYRIAVAAGDLNRLDVLARELVGQNVDVIVAPTSTATRAAQRASKTIPIVMTGVGDPVSQGFVVSLAKPGGNITGIANRADELLGKLIQILHEVAPQSRRVAILLNETNPVAAALFRAAARSACAELGLTAIWVAANAPAELAGAVEQIVGQRAQAVVVAADPMYYSERFKLQALLHATRLPVGYGHRENVVAGGLLGYTSNFVANFRRAATFVDKILKGAKPADLPVEQPTKFELVINLKTARALGLTIPQSLLLRVDEVIE
jgi:putative ABC transport system substrate-binding protein